MISHEEKFDANLNENMQIDTTYLTNLCNLGLYPKTYHTVTRASKTNVKFHCFCA